MLTRNFNGGWTSAPNKIINSDRLSWKAKALWIYINSKPEAYDFAVERIIKETKDGEKATRSGLKELVENGLLKYQAKGDGIKFTGQDYILFDDFDMAFQDKSPCTPKRETPKRGDTQKGGDKIKLKEVKLNINKTKEKTNKKIFPYQDELDKLLEIWNTQTGGIVRSTKPMEEHYEHWRALYTFEQIQNSMANFAKDEFWKTQHPKMLFRKLNTKGEALDRIAKFYQTIKHQIETKRATYEDFI